MIRPTDLTYKMHTLKLNCENVLKLDCDELPCFDKFVKLGCKCQLAACDQA